MRICLHTIWDVSHGFIGGTERFLVELAKELKILGADPFILCTGDNFEKSIEGVKVFGRVPPEYRESLLRLGEAKGAYVKNNFAAHKTRELALRALAKHVQYQCDQVDKDILHLNSFASLAFLNSKEPIIVTNHENSEESEALWGENFFPSLRAVLASMPSRCPNTKLAVPSVFYADEYSNFFGHKIHGVPLGVNLGTFQPNFDNNVQSSAGHKILLPSRLEPKQKGHDIALEALKILLVQHPQTELIFSGLRRDNENHVALLKEQAHKLGVSEHVIFKKYRDMGRAYAEANIIWSPERFCSYGLSISEALSLGKPTILSDIPTYLEIGGKFDHAFFFQTESASGLAGQTAKVISGRRNSYSVEMIKFRMENDLRRCASRYMEFYLQALGS